MTFPTDLPLMSAEERQALQHVHDRALARALDADLDPDEAHRFAEMFVVEWGRRAARAAFDLAAAALDSSRLEDRPAQLRSLRDADSTLMAWMSRSTEVGRAIRSFGITYGRLQPLVAPPDPGEDDDERARNPYAWHIAGNP